ncbi:SGNH/GDSL hydrolase family protein [Oceanobacillus halotolerans]|uniref:SGNH/GDSL hydrolase family protein n=1 Tax=Oceanobacillus halotolerans TaxID=2663380 RepID=UPI001CF79197|nr:SGNH/GDSL hydrolase family protein [Oceanobacillus halotolerans]
MKKLVTFLSIFLVIGAGAVFFIIWDQQSNTPTIPATQIEETTENQEQDSDENSEEAITEEEVENGENMTNQFVDIISEAVQKTIRFFSKETHIVAIGDSLTQGVGDETKQGGYVGILDESINESEQHVTFENYGKRGNRSDQLLKRLDEAEITSSLSEADIILITIGANDIMQVFKENITNLQLDDFMNERTKYEERLNQIVAKLHDVNDHALIYFIGFYNPFNSYFQDIEELSLIVDEWNRTTEMVSNNHDNITFIPTVDLFEGTSEDLLAEDNFHPNYNGYQRIAKRVLDYVTD